MAKKDSQGDVLDDALDTFKGLSVHDQQAYIAQLQALAEEKKQGEIARLKEQLAALGVSMAAPPTVRKPRTDGERVRAAPRAKYRDPVSGAEWAGRGRTASWLAAYEAEGRSRDEFLIKED